MNANSCATQLPWIEHPFRLISWLEMNKFSAEHFYKIGSILGSTIAALNQMIGRSPMVTIDEIEEWLGVISTSCRELGLIQSAKAANRLLNEEGPGADFSELLGRLESLRSLIGSEMEEELFFSVPRHRSEWYGKSADVIIGPECCQRFSSIQREVEEAVKCYALGRHTACAFHLTRATEAGIQALAKAINYTQKDKNWTLVFRQLGSEFNIVMTKPRQDWPQHWQTHKDFLEGAWGDLRAVSRAWRNDIAHLVDTYSEEDAKMLLDVIPHFLRHLAVSMDENGTLY